MEHVYSQAVVSSSHPLSFFYGVVWSPWQLAKQRAPSPDGIILPSKSWIQPSSLCSANPPLPASWSPLSRRRRHPGGWRTFAPRVGSGEQVLLLLSDATEGCYTSTPLVSPPTPVLLPASAQTGSPPSALMKKTPPQRRPSYVHFNLF